MAGENFRSEDRCVSILCIVLDFKRPILSRKQVTSAFIFNSLLEHIFLLSIRVPKIS